MPNWGQVLDEITAQRNASLAQGNIANQQARAQAEAAADTVRQKYLNALHQKTGRNVIAYYSGWLSKPDIKLADIIDEDKNGFMMAVHQLDRSIGLDLILHTPGGRLSAAESIVDYLHKMFKKDMRAIVPQMAMSAGTMMACSCHTIFLGTHSNLGPIDPQLAGLPAYGVIAEFKRAAREIKKDMSKIAVWQPILSKYHPTFLSECENAIKWSTSFVQRQLETIMFKGRPDATDLAKKAVQALTSYRGNRGHDKHLHYDECKGMNLNVEKIETDPEFQDLVLTVHHCYMHKLMNTTVFKLIENQHGRGMIKFQGTLQGPANPLTPPP